MFCNFLNLLCIGQGVLMKIKLCTNENSSLKPFFLNLSPRYLGAYGKIFTPEEVPAKYISVVLMHTTAFDLLWEVMKL